MSLDTTQKATRVRYRDTARPRLQQKHIENYAARRRAPPSRLCTDAAFVRPPWPVIKVGMASSAPTSYTVSAIHPDTREFYGESCATLEDAQRRAKELREARYHSVTIAPAR
jgi:hypothetical protein